MSAAETVVTRIALAGLLADRLDITGGVARQAVGLIFDALADQLAAGGRIEIRGLGSFDCPVRKGRVRRNPRTGEPVPKADRLRIRFRPSGTLTRRLQEPATPAGTAGT